MPKARGSTFKPFPPKNLWFDFDFARFHEPHAKEIAEAIVQTAEAQLHPPIKNLGVSGMRHASAQLLKWPSLFNEFQLRMNLFNLYIFIEIGGTGCGAFRATYARFLDEAAALARRPVWTDAAKIFRESARRFSSIALLFKDAATAKGLEEKIRMHRCALGRSRSSKNGCGADSVRPPGDRIHQTTGSIVRGLHGICENYWMGKRFTGLEPAHHDFIQKQKIFFVASATAESRVNLSPKDVASLRILDSQRLVYLDQTGSGNETAAHLRADGRLTLMFCALEGAPLILRLYGKGAVLARRSPAYAEMLALHFGDVEPPGARQIVVLDVDLVQTSCGYGVPQFDFAEERATLRRWAEAKGEEGIAEYWRAKNSKSIDGLPTGILDGTEEERSDAIDADPCISQNPLR